MSLLIRKMLFVPTLLLALADYGLGARILPCQNSDLQSEMNFTAVGHTEFNNSLLLSCRSGYAGSGTAQCGNNGRWVYDFNCTALVVCARLPKFECLSRNNENLLVTNAAVGVRLPIKCCESSSFDAVVYKTCQANGKWSDAGSLKCKDSEEFQDSTKLHPGIIAAIVCGFLFLICTIAFSKWYCIFRAHRGERVGFERGSMTRAPRKSLRSHRSDSRPPSIAK